MIRNLAALLLIIGLGLSSCSKKITNPEIQRLESREDLLEETTRLNKLKIELEKEMLKERDLTPRVEAANATAAKSADKAKELSDDLSSRPGNGSLSSKAERASKVAARDAKRAKKVNSDLEDTRENIEDLQKKIQKSEANLAEMEKRIDFVPNNQQAPQ